MTAEAVVMNKAAVAMAADSAVTISSGRRGLKVFDSMNKLFELVDGSSVGVMIYGNAELNGLPWESAVKIYRRSRRGFRATNLESYVADFCGYLADPANVLSADTDTSTVLNVVYGKLLSVFDYIDRGRLRWVSRSGRPIKSKLRQVLVEALDLLEDFLDSAEEAPWAEELTEAVLLEHYGEAIDKMIREIFVEFGLTPAVRNRIVELGIEAIRRCTPESADTGLVIAGFAGNSPLPKMYEATVRGRVNGVLRLADPTWNEVTIDEPSYLSTFAQDEEAWGFVSGITSDVRNAVMEYWDSWHKGFGIDVLECVKAVVPSITQSQARKIEQEVAKLAHQKFQEFLANMQERQEEHYIKPMLDSLAALPKDELGVLAESLVSVTSLKQRMSIFDPETVGGPIDVALISPGDGFVWLKRKHYFSRELNPAWYLTHHVNLTNGGDGDAEIERE